VVQTPTHTLGAVAGSGPSPVRVVLGDGCEFALARSLARV